MIIEAAKRLKAHIEMAMSIDRKAAIRFLELSEMPMKLRDHFALVQMLPTSQDVPHWQIECRALLMPCLHKTNIKGGKTLPLSDFLKYMWKAVGEAQDFEIACSQLLYYKNMQHELAVLRTVDFDFLSMGYKSWLTKWYNVYTNPHAKPRYILPSKLF